MAVSRHLISGVSAVVKAAGKDRMTAAICRALLVGYEMRWGVPTWAIEAVEELGLASPGDPSAATDGYLIGGKLDLIYREAGGRVLCDHKSTGADIGNQASPYWNHLSIDSQISHYLLIEAINKRPFSKIMWDVVKRPTIWVKALSKEAVRLLSETGMYCGLKAPEAAAREAIAKKFETPEVFECRLAIDCAKTRPDFYYQRRELFRDEADMKAYILDLAKDSEDLARDAGSSYHKRDPGSCLRGGKQCRFFDLCNRTDSIDSGKWKRKLQIHAELPAALGGADPAKVLTNSRLSTFRECPRKHEYEYIRAIEPAGGKPDRVLFFGTVWHAGLEAYFKSVQEEQQKCKR